MAVVSHFHNEKLSHWRLILDQGGITPEVQSFPYRGAGTKHDPYVVGWIVNDPRSPLLFSRSRKWTITIINSLETLSVAFASSAISGGARQVETQYKIGSEIMALCISLFVLGIFYSQDKW